LISLFHRYGYNATLLFADPLPAGLLRYDMMLSLDRVASVRVTGSSFGSATVPNSGGRGMLTSGHGVEIIGNVFRNLCANNNLLFLNGKVAFGGRTSTGNRHFPCAPHYYALLAGRVWS